MAITRSLRGALFSAILTESGVLVMIPDFRGKTQNMVLNDFI